MDKPRINRGKRLRALPPETYLTRLRRQIVRHCVKTVTGCWLWTGTKQRNGYGSTRVLGKVTPAHRAAYLAFKGEIHPDMEIMHRCDVRNCVNPRHLKIGTHAENMREMHTRGRGRNGVMTGAYIPTRNSLGQFLGEHK